MSAPFPLGKADTLHGRPDCWSGVGWLLVAAGLVATADALALPDADIWLGMPMSGDEMFRPEWLVAATLAALPLYRLARASLFLGVVGFFLLAGEMFTIVDNARGRFAQNAELFGTGPDFPPLYYAVAAIQTAVFLVAAIRGLRLRWSDRRFDAIMRKLSAESGVPVRDASARQHVPD